MAALLLSCPLSPAAGKTITLSNEDADRMRERQKEEGESGKDLPHASALIQSVNTMLKDFLRVNNFYLSKDTLYPKTRYEWSFETLSGAKVSFEEYRKRAVFLCFWATWCPPCNYELPMLQKFYEDMRGQGLAFIVVSNEDPESISQFIKSRGYTFPVYRMSDDPPNEFYHSGIPANFIIDRQGNVVFEHLGLGWESAFYQRYKPIWQKMARQKKPARKK